MTQYDKGMSLDKKTPGRNDPCPCGSGKKYKNCCLNRDRTRRIRESAWRSDEQATLDKLLAFAQRPEWNPQYTVAFNLFWNGTYGMVGLNVLDHEEVGRFLDWYLYDYRLEGSAKRLIELFAEETESRLLAAERERVRAWQSSYLSLYRITDPAEDGSLPVVDALQGERAMVWHSGLGRLSLPGDLILGRVLRSSVPPHFSWAAVLLPAGMERGLVSFVTDAYTQYRETHSAASWPDFLSNSGYMFNHSLLKSAAESGKQRYTNKAYYDAFRTVEKLREAEKRLREQAAKKAEELRKAEPALHPAEEREEPLRQTQGGILLPGHVHYKGSKEVES
jgi:ribosomal protein S20